MLQSNGEGEMVAAAPTPSCSIYIKRETLTFFSKCPTLPPEIRLEKQITLIDGVLKFNLYTDTMQTVSRP